MAKQWEYITQVTHVAIRALVKKIEDNNYGYDELLIIRLMSQYQNIREAHELLYNEIYEEIIRQLEEKNVRKTRK